MSSKRGYLTIAELEEYANITVDDETEAFDQITQAEEIIDAYVGPQQKSVPLVHYGQVASAVLRVIVDNSSTSHLKFADGYFVGATIEIIGGAGAGQLRTITASSRNDQSVTVDSNWDNQPDSTSVFKIYQLGKFPRTRDVYCTPSPNSTYYKSIPDAVKRATAAQVQFMINQGDNFFSSDDSDKTSESIGNYSYSRGGGSGGSSRAAYVSMVAPKARSYLRGIMNAKGNLTTEPAFRMPFWRNSDTILGG